MTESPASRRIYAVSAVLLAIGWFIIFHAYWAPANDGVDQNGYLVGGRLFSEHLSIGTEPPDLFSYIGSMWIGTPWQAYYPKYPIGLPMLYAGCLKLGQTTIGRVIAFEFSNLEFGLLPVVIFIVLRSLLRIRPIEGSIPSRWRILHTPICLLITIVATCITIRQFWGPLDSLPTEGPTVGVELCYLLNPVSTMIALVGTFYLVRMVASSFAGLMAIICLGCSPVTVQLANNSNSHSTSLMFVTWGMYLLISWWQNGGAIRAAGAGFLIGYAATIRYTEGMLVLPLVVALVLAKPWQNWRRFIESALLAAWWAIPVMFLVAYNLGAFGDVTGYDSTNESTGFSWEYFTTNWDTTIRQLYNTGLFFLFPTAIIALFIMLVQRWKLGLILASWLFPSLILYTAYYWAPDNNSVSYLRFYLTIFPCLTMLAFWLLGGIVPMALEHSNRIFRGGWAIVAGCAIFAILSGGMIYFSTGDLAWLGEHPQAQQPNTAPAGNRPGATAAREAEHAQDMDRIGSDLQYVLANYPKPLGVTAAGVALVYCIGWGFSKKPSRLFFTFAGSASCVGCGLLALSSAAMSLYIAVPFLEQNLARNLQSAVAADMLVNDVHAPAGSLVFSNSSILNHIQLVGDYQVYNLAQFNVAYVRGLAPDRFDPTQPNPLQAERAALLYHLLGKYTAEQLIAEEQKIVDQALDEGKPVYVLIPSAQLPSVRGQFFGSKKYDLVTRAVWQEIPATQTGALRGMRAVGAGLLGAPGGRRGAAGGGGGRAAGRGAGRGGGGGGGGRAAGARGAQPAVGATQSPPSNRAGAGRRGNPPPGQTVAQPPPTANRAVRRGAGAGATSMPAAPARAAAKPTPAPSPPAKPPAPALANTTRGTLWTIAEVVPISQTKISSAN